MSSMRLHRTTARGALLLILLAAVTASAAVAHPPPVDSKPKPKQAVGPIVFPVVGPVGYTNDFGDPRGSRGHEGNDIMAPRRSLAVAAEGGTVKFWTTSSSAGCMLYLYGDSGRTYLYIHLNNDLTLGNDNRGKCVPGVSYATGLANGDRVEAGQHVGFVGDSGDANGVGSHLHFEVHPGGGSGVNPFPYLNAATHLLFAAAPDSTFTLALTGTVVATGAGSIQIAISQVRSWPGGRRTPFDGKTVVEVSLPDTAEVDEGAVTAMLTPKLDRSLKGKTVVVWTAPAKATLAARSGAKGALEAARVVLKNAG